MRRFSDNGSCYGECGGRNLSAYVSLNEKMMYCRRLILGISFLEFVY